MSTAADHNLFLPLALLLLLLPHTADAQQTSTPSPTYGFSSKFNPTVAVVVVLLISAFFFAGFLFVYCRQRATQRRDGSRRRAWITAARSRRQAAVEAARGLDPEVVAAFPTVVYADVKGHRLGDHADAPLECAVCLCEFDEEESLALLPKCSHAFHPECIAEWLKSHTTCPVCRANLAAEEEEAGEGDQPCEPTVVGTSSSTTNNQDESRPARPDEHHVPVVAIKVDDDGEEEADKYPAELTRIGSTRKDPLPPPKKSLRTWRSRSARPAIGDRVGQFWGEEERERFTLRLPEDVRREVMAGKLPRSGSVSGAFPAGTGLRSSRRGYIGGGGDEGSSRSGRNHKMGLGRWDRMAKSDRGWAALGRAVAGMGSRHGGGGSRRGGVEGERAGAAQTTVPDSAPVAADDTKIINDVTKGAGGEADGEGSVTSRGTHVLAAVRDQFNCLIRGGSKKEQGSSSGKDDDEASTAALNKV